MKTVLKHLSEYKKECVLAPLFKLLETCLELTVPIVIASIIDRGIGDGDKPWIYRMTLTLIVLALVGLAAAITAQYFSAKAAIGCSASIRESLFRHIQSLSYPDLDSMGASALITRITGDVTQVQTGINLTLRLILRAPFVVFGAMIMAFTVDVKCALIFCVMIPVLLIAVFAVMLGCVPLYKKVQRHLDTVTRTVRENLIGARVLRAFAKEDDERKKFAEENGALSRIQLFTGRISALMSPATYLTVNLCIAWMIARGGLRVSLGDLTQGEVIALYNYMSQILVELIKMANLIITMTKAFASADRITEVIDYSPSLKGGELTRAENFTLHFENVSFAYPGAAETSVENISFTLENGKTLGIIGATGSGKSTLAFLASRFYDPCEGSITLGGRPISEYDNAFLRDHIGFVPQKAVLFGGTIRENILAGKDYPDSRINEALATSQATDVIASKVRGLDEKIGAGGAGLSGGQRQRLTIARAVVREPEILILDDSSSALDYRTDAALRRSVAECSFKPATVIISQRASSVMDADEILVMDDGRCVARGTHDSLLHECDIYREIYETQFGKAAV